MNATVLPLLLLFLVGFIPARADDKPDDKPKDKEPPAPKLPLGKDTTYVTGPLDKLGYIDYESALNAEMSRGVTRENNANVLLIQAFGPAPEGGDGLPPAYFRWLDIPAPPKDGEYLYSLGKLGRERLALTDAQFEAVYDQQSRAGQRPWAAKDYSVIAEWLKANEKQLALVREAVKRPRYFNPLCSRRKEGEPSNLIGTLLPSVQKCRELASLLTTHAMLCLHEGKLDEAWQDLLACHRLARHTSRGATLIEGLVGVAIGQIASNSTLAYLEHAKLTSKQAAERLKDLQNLPPFAPYADKIDIGERMMGLDAIQMIRRGGGAGIFDGDTFGLDNKPSEEQRKVLESLDWTAGLQNANKWYDQMAAALRMKDRAEREKEIDKVEKELQDRSAKVRKMGNLSKLLLEKNQDKAVATALTDVLMGLLTPAVRKVQIAHDRAEQTERNLQLAFAMAAYHADNDRYPAKLDDLAPKYIAAVPSDLFSGKALIYKPEEKGYLFYSVGPNGKDDGGRYYDDDPPGDDPRVKMPLPPLKKN